MIGFDPMTPLLSGQMGLTKADKAAAARLTDG